MNKLITAVHICFLHDLMLKLLDIELDQEVIGTTGSTTLIVQICEKRDHRVNNAKSKPYRDGAIAVQGTIDTLEVVNSYARAMHKNL
jgi:hypothetical protein